MDLVCLVSTFTGVKTLLQDIWRNVKATLSLLRK